MAEVVGGFASSHGSTCSLPAELWEWHGQSDMHSRQLITVPEGRRVTYEQVLAQADPNIAKSVNIETYRRQVENIQKGLDDLEDRFRQTEMDVVVMFGDDQAEWFFEDNMPTINVFWGESVKVLPRPGVSDEYRSYLTEEQDWPVDTELGLHVIESLMEQDFDTAQSRYQKQPYGGSIGPATWYLDGKRTTEPRVFGIPHAYGLPLGRWFAGKTVPILPISINTCYPPNWISPSRAYALGRAVRRAIDSWKSDKRVAFACSGGLSHAVVDEELDRMAWKGLQDADSEILTSLPRHRLQANTTEILNWVATQGAMGDARMDPITYEATYRTLAGTGLGCAVGHWPTARR